MVETKYDQMKKRKTEIQRLKFQRVIEKEGGDIESNKLQNQQKIQEVCKMLMDSLNNELLMLADDKKIKIFQWINYWIYYLSTEDTFNPRKLRTYKRGDILHVNFGFNVHNELGGLHYAVVVEVDNAPASGCVTVVPLRSEDTEEAACNAHEETEVYLGKGIVPVGKTRDKYTVAKVNQIRAIDKMRIIKPKNDHRESAYPLDPEIRKEILDKIDKKIIELFTKPQKSG